MKNILSSKNAIHRALLTAFVLFVIWPGSFAGASAPAHAISLVAALSADGANPDGDEVNGIGAKWDWFVHWVGHFHPALTAFPIAMLFGAAAAECLMLAGAGAWLDGASRWCVIVAAAGAAVTAPLGWAFALDHGASWILEVHRWLGTAAGAGAIFVLILSEISRRKRGGWLVLFRVILFAAVALVGATGFFGGAMVYGLHAYAWNPR